LPFDRRLTPFALREDQLLKASNANELLSSNPDRTSTPAVEIIGLTKNYGEPLGSNTPRWDLVNLIRQHRGRIPPHITALNGVNITVNRGEVFGLLGPNGAGKTTLIKIMSTLLLPDSGSVSVNGVDVLRNPRHALRHLQSVLAQASGFEVRLSGRRNLEFYAALYGIPHALAKSRIDELLAFTSLTDKADLEFQKYSTGMARRLLVARALLSNASILVFDEPTSSLDPVSALEFRHLMRDQLVTKEHKTVFLATHNLQEAQQICDRVSLIKSGKVILTDTPARIRRLVADKIAISMILSSPMMIEVDSFSSELSRISGVINAKVETREYEFELEVEASKDLDYPRLFLLLEKFGFRVVTLEASEPTLEDAFLTIVKGEKG